MKTFAFLQISHQSQLERWNPAAGMRRQIFYPGSREICISRPCFCVFHTISARNPKADNEVLDILPLITTNLWNYKRYKRGSPYEAILVPLKCVGRSSLVSRPLGVLAYPGFMSI